MMLLWRLVLVWLCLHGGAQIAGAEMISQQPTRSELRQLGVPPGANVFLHAKTTCTPPPIKLRAWLALACETVQKGRECMGARKNPIYVGKCSGRECFMPLVPGPTTCMLQPFGVDVQLNNASRVATCGLDPNDAYWLHPFKAEAAVEGEDFNCINGLPKEIEFRIWAPCVDGEPRQHGHMAFNNSMPDEYVCVSNPQCKSGNFNSHIMCYTLPVNATIFSQVTENEAMESGAMPKWRSVSLIATLTAWVFAFVTGIIGA